MAATTYQINRDLSSTVQTQTDAFEILNSVALNATQGYGFTILDVSLDGAGRLRIKLSQALPQVEVDSFRGDILVV